MTKAAETQAASGRVESGEELELTVVMPCLSEAATVGACVKKARGAMEQHGIRGEVVVADNGSTDGSQQIAAEAGALLLPGPRFIGGVVFDVHTLLFAAMAILIGFQSILFATFSKVFAITEGLLPEDPRLNKLFRVITLETGLAAGAVLVVAGIGAWVLGLTYWQSRHFGPLDPEKTLRIVIPGVVCFTLGFQIILSSFFLSVLGMARR